MRQWAHLFQWLEAVKTMRPYITHNMDRNKELLVDLEMAMSEVVVAQKLVEEGVCLLMKAEEEMEAF